MFFSLQGLSSRCFHVSPVMPNVLVWKLMLLISQAYLIKITLALSRVLLTHLFISYSEITSTYPNFKSIKSCQMLPQFSPSPLLSHQIRKADPPPHLILPSSSLLLLLLVYYSIFLMPGEWNCKVLPPFQRRYCTEEEQEMSSTEEEQEMSRIE